MKWCAIRFLHWRCHAKRSEASRKPAPNRDSSPTAQNDIASSPSWNRIRIGFVGTALIAVFVVSANAEEAPRVWIRDRASLEREIGALLRELTPGSAGENDARSLLDALETAGAVESAAPTGTEPDDDLALSGSSEAVSTLIETVRARLTTGSKTQSTATTDVLKRTVGALRVLMRREGVPASVLSARLDGSTARFRRSVGNATVKEKPLSAWATLPSDGIFAGSARLNVDASRQIERWLTALTGVPFRGLALPVDAGREIAVAARFDRSQIPDTVFVSESNGETRDAVLREMLRTAIGTLAPNLPVSEVRTEPRRALRWLDAEGWTFPVRVLAPGAPARFGLWHAVDGERLLVTLGERPDAIEWVVGAARRNRTMRDALKAASAYGDAAWWFSPTAMLRETARVKGAGSYECRTLSRILESLESPMSVSGLRYSETTADTTTFDLRDWAMVLSALDAASVLNVP